jgi:hypothetical protein
MSSVNSTTTKREEYTTTTPVSIAMKGAAAPPAAPTNGNGNGNGASYDDYNEASYLASGNGNIETRPARRPGDGGGPPAPRGRHSLPDVSFRAANRPSSNPQSARTQELVEREIDRAERRATTTLQHDQNRNNGRTPSSGLGTNANGPNGTGVSANREMFDDNIQRLNKVWAAQEATRLRAGAEDAKIYMGIKYERKQNGPFEGKLVSQGKIISIDGEDYVEYRVLTKPSFF